MLLIFFSEISSNYSENYALIFPALTFSAAASYSSYKQINKRTPVPIRTAAIRPAVAFARLLSLNRLSVVTACATCLRLRSQSFVAAVIRAEARNTRAGEISKRSRGTSTGTLAEYDMHCATRGLITCL
ncbi:hypothetical protein [Bradyrhizobium elkanii]